ncbi:class I SAM-dependent methyltransferase [Pseudalkalibacillus berkeleyi]|uniref:Class I SAM-dependent methyltransferase n=1 Tax=Pseudalkalibacillus berkeleyi TaxID=1069813 RepID=A0ABS9H3X3_9BACL|nr:class I SAM-dependent methyltransferase [Pseudalkalibacillus berkeleyi]MCF6138355.1 class I SAM-dependent methyltransferase [Pseudalkalibacillus berkeleyi]
MNLSRVLPFAKELLQKVVEPGGIVVDATMGNGHDTVYLAELVGETGQVYGFDVQEKAVTNTKERLQERGLENRAQILLKGHESVKEVIPSDQHGQVQAAIFNLGYLPGSDKQIITKPDSTLKAVQSLLDILRPGGLIILVVYYGHEGGSEEKEQLMSYLKELDQPTAHVMQYQFINQKNNPPFLIAVEKR